MFLDQLRDTEQVLFRYKNKQNTISNEGALSNNLAAINTAVQEILVQMELSQEAKSDLVPAAGMEKERAEALYGLLMQLQSDLDDGVDVSEGKQSLSKISREFTETENKKWKDAVEKKANTQRSLMQQLGGFSDNPDVASTIALSLKYNTTQMPRNVQDIQKYAKMLRNAENIVQNVGGTPTVMEFIQKVTSGQAVLADLNDEVKKWIEDHHMGQRLKIIL